jgi:hypothetical protein
MTVMEIKKVTMHYGDARKRNNKLELTHFGPCVKFEVDKDFNEQSYTITLRGTLL